MKNGDVNAIKNINRKITYRFLLDGEELPLSDIMDNPTITYDCGLEQYSVGNLYIGELSFSVKNTVFVNYKSKIEIEIQQIDNYTYYTNYIGTFYVSTVEEQGLTKRIKAYDELFTLNVGYFPSAKHTSTKAIMEDIARKHYIFINQNGVGLDEAYTWTHGDIAINNEQLEGKTVLEMLSLVAGVHGGSFFIDGYGYLKLAQPTLATSNVTFTQSEYSVPTLDDTTTYNITKLRVIYGEQTTNDDGSIKDTGYYEVGSGTDTHTLAISNPLLKGKQAQAEVILNQIKAMNGYKRFDTTILLGDYRLEPMDVITYVKGDTSYKVPIIYMQFGLTHNGFVVKTQSPTIAESKKEFSFKGTITQKIDNVYTEVMQVKDIVANTITVDELEAINAKIENLEATDATITNLVADKASINDLKATNAEIDNLQADYAEIDKLVANKADITSLHATNANIDKLKADVADINTLLAGNITGGNIQAGSITSDKLTIDDGFIKDAMIDTVNANKILAGRLDTGAITIGSDDGKMIIADETIQISDGKNVRVQIGETANGDYALVIWDEDGNVMFDATGITENAIKDSIIKDDMISDNANINAQKIDISSLFSAINNDGSNTLSASKIYLDTQEQTLNVAFRQMNTRQDSLESKTNTLTTELNVEKGKISSLVQETTILEQEQVTLNDKVTSVTQDINGVTTKVENMESTFTEDLEVMEQRISSAEMKITEDAIVSTVTNSTIFKDSIGDIVSDSNMNIGARNLLKQTRNFSEVVQGSNEWSIEDSGSFSPTGVGGGGDANFKQLTCDLASGYNPRLVAIPLYSKFKSLSTDLTLTLEYRGNVHQVLLGLSDGHITKVIGYYGGSNEQVRGEVTGMKIVPSSFNGVELSDFKVLGTDGAWTRVSYTFSASYVNGVNKYHENCSCGATSEEIQHPEELNYYLVLFGRRTGYVGDGWTCIRKPKLETGRVVSDWSSAPNDLEEDVAEEFEITYTKIEQNAENITLTAGRTDANEEAISSLQVNADSISASVQRVEQSVTSSLDGMNQNITSLTKRVDATMTSEDIKFEISKELSNGVTTVKTATGFTFNEDGLTIDKTDSEMTTQITEDGMVITKNNETVLTANNKGVQAKNLYATTYLIVGNSRFESYRGNRTGCFYVFEPSIEMTEETNLLNEEGEE